jgi:hypothetical protein
MARDWGTYVRTVGASPLLFFRSDR